NAELTAAEAGRRPRGRETTTAARKRSDAVTGRDKTDCPAARFRRSRSRADGHSRQASGGTGAESRNSRAILDGGGTTHRGQVGGEEADRRSDANRFRGTGPQTCSQNDYGSRIFEKRATRPNGRKQAAQGSGQQTRFDRSRSQTQVAAIQKICPQMPAEKRRSTTDRQPLRATR